MSKGSKKEELTTAIMNYVTNNIFDISKFRLENPKLYATIPYYFGSIDKMFDDLKLIKVQKSQTNKVTFRNRLAYDYLSDLRKKHTLDEIGKMYNVSRALVNQQFQALDLMIKTEKVENSLKQ